MSVKCYMQLPPLRRVEQASNIPVRCGHFTLSVASVAAEQSLVSRILTVIVFELS